MSKSALDHTLSVTHEADREWLVVPTVRLHVEVKDQEPVTKQLGLRWLTLGTGADCDVVCADPQVSRRHCRLSLTEQGVLLEDLESKNGTFVAGARISKGWLYPGQTAVLGTTRLTLTAEEETTRVPLSPGFSFGAAYGVSTAMRALFAQLERVAATDSTVLLLGETGTGKELLARGLHDHSPRASGPFVVLDCAGVPASLLENELFGHERGAFTGADTARPGVVERAAGGTLFIDEVGELPLAVQSKLLRVLEERTVQRLGGNQPLQIDFRVVAATHRDLRARVKTGEFREDLFFRLSVLELPIPPLRDRRDDLPVLVERLLATRDPPRTLASLPPHVMEMLKSHRWPGNVRELRNTIERLAVMPDPAQLRLDPPTAAGSASAQGSPFFTLPLREARVAAAEAFEKAYLLEKLRAHGDNVSAAAHAMGVSRQLLYRLVAEHDLAR
ncbi:MAG: sigma 54-interacting transcriptional regulator [Archangiaceae bacterium]|nr:sigma 54-interacting transcriptional regulator [Archangiaceae bacterium]